MNRYLSVPRLIEIHRRESIQNTKLNDQNPFIV